MKKKIAKDLLSIKAVFFRPRSPLLGPAALKVPFTVITASPSPRRLFAWM